MSLGLALIYGLLGSRRNAPLLGIHFLRASCSVSLAALIWEIFQKVWRDGVQILLLWVVIYQLYRAFKATRGARILVGLSTILVGLTLVSGFLELEEVSWILRQAVFMLAFALLIIFQPEIRNGLARIGSSRFFSFEQHQQLEFLEMLENAVVQLSKNRFGALFVFERNISLKEVADTGVMLDSELSVELAMTLFFPKTVLHDGGVVLSEERVVAAACVFPVSQKELADRSLGLRHRAAIGVTEETDAVALVVSEETGSISVAQEGRLEKFKTTTEFRERLRDILLNHETDTTPRNQQPRGKGRLADPSNRDLVSD